MGILDEDDERNQHPGRTILRPRGSLVGRAARTGSDEATRAQLVHVVEAAKKDLEIELAALRRADPANMNLSAVERGETKLRQLDALLDRLASAPPGAILAALRAEVGVAVAASSGVVVQTSAAASSVASYTMAQISISQDEYRRATAELDRKVAQSYAAEAPHLAYAHDIAKRYGIDISAYQNERKTLDSERDEARKKGDKLGERTADALIAHNTFNTLAAEYDRITDPEARRRHINEMLSQQKIIDERAAAIAAQAELNARRAATEKNLPPDQAKTFIEQFKKERMEEYDSRVRGLNGAGKGDAIRRIIAPGNLSANEPNVDTPNSVTGLSPDVRAAVEQAASTIRAADKAADAEFELNPGVRTDVRSASSKIALSTTTDAHEKVEPPKTPVAKRDTGKATTVA